MCGIDLLDDVALFHFGYPPLMKLMYADGGTQVSSLYRRAKATGVTTSLDMAFPGSSSVDAPWRRILTLTLPHVDIFLPSIEEILVTLRRETYERMRRKRRMATSCRRSRRNCSPTSAASCWRWAPRSWA